MIYANRMGCQTAVATGSQPDRGQMVSRRGIRYPKYVDDLMLLEDQMLADLVDSMLPAITAQLSKSSLIVVSTPK